jgi:hypothetical protein
MLKPQQIVRLYEKGVCTELEMLHYLMVALADADVGAFLGSASPELLKKVAKFVRGLPKTERGWSRGIHIDGGLSWAETTEEQRQAALAEDSRRFRRGVEAVRAHFSRNREEG